MPKYLKSAEREEKVQELCKHYLYEHNEMRDFMSGFGVRTECKCNGCQLARELLKEN